MLVLTIARKLWTPLIPFLLALPKMSKPIKKFVVKSSFFFNPITCYEIKHMASTGTDGILSKLLCDLPEIILEILAYIFNQSFVTVKQGCGSSRIFFASASGSSWSVMLPIFCFCFRLRIKLVTSEFASSLFCQNASIRILSLPASASSVF